MSFAILDDLFWVVRGADGSIVFFVKVRDRGKVVTRKGVGNFYAREHFQNFGKEVIGGEESLELGAKHIGIRGRRSQRLWSGLSRE